MTTGNPLALGRALRLLLEALVFLLATLLPASQIGCAVPTVRQTTRFLPGDTFATFDRPASDVLLAAEQVVRDLDLDVLRCDRTGLDGLVVARSQNNGEVQVSVKSASPTRSRVWVRVGVLGDSKMQHTILARMREQLSAPPTVAEAATW